MVVVCVCVHAVCIVWHTFNTNGMVWFVFCVSACAGLRFKGYGDGVYITKVDRKGVAQIAGCKEGMRVLVANGVAIKTQDEVLKAIHNMGNRIDLDVCHGHEIVFTNTSTDDKDIKEISWNFGVWLLYLPSNLLEC